MDTFKQIKDLIGEEYKLFTFYENGKFSIIFARHDYDSDYDLYFLTNGEEVYSIPNWNVERFLNCKMQYEAWKYNK